MCSHNDEDRQFWGAWATCELYKAMEKGYRVMKISEVYDYDVWAQIQDGLPDSGMFTEYINTFLKTKQQVRFIYFSISA